jgi:hypothetical protein
VIEPRPNQTVATNAATQSRRARHDTPRDPSASHPRLPFTS